MSSSLDVATKTKLIEIEDAKLNTINAQLQKENAEIKQFLVKLIANQNILADRLSAWPWLPHPEKFKGENETKN